MQRFTRIADEFVNGLSTGPAGQEPLTERGVEPESGFRARRRFFFLDLFELAPPESRVASWVRSGARSRKAIQDYLRVLLDLNSVRVVNDFDERVTESRRGLEAEVSVLIHKRLDAAQRGLERARAVRNARAGALEAEIQRIDDLAARLAFLVPKASVGSRIAARHSS